MSPEEIIDAYNVLRQDVENYTADAAAKIGNSQRSLGTLAERVASPSGQTSGLANYTYDRTLRPVVDSMATGLTTSGMAQALEKDLDTKLRAAKNAYEDAKNAYTVAASLPKNDNNYDEKEKPSTTVKATTPEGMTSHTFTYDDGTNKYTGIVYFNSDGSIAGYETPNGSYTAGQAITFYNENKDKISGWGGKNGSVYNETTKEKTATAEINTGKNTYPEVVDMDGMTVLLVKPAQGDPYYITKDGMLKFSVNDVMKWF